MRTPCPEQIQNKGRQESSHTYGRARKDRQDIEAMVAKIDAYDGKALPLLNTWPDAQRQNPDAVLPALRTAYRLPMAAETALPICDAK